MLIWVCLSCLRKWDDCLKPSDHPCKGRRLLLLSPTEAEFLEKTHGSPQSRIQELLEAGDRLLKEARDERAAHAKTKWELALVRDRAMALEAENAQLRGAS